MSELELYRKHRPTKFSDVVGQEAAMKTLKAWFTKKTFPHAVLITGPSGVGKTTLARLLKTKLNCSDMDYTEINCAGLESPIDTIRSIQQTMLLSPVCGSSRIWYLDEAAAVRRSMAGQEAMLKMLEDGPPHAYFILATTDPDKLLKTIRTRCNTLNLKPLKADTLKSVVDRVLKLENITVSEAVQNKLVEIAEGSARQILSDLHRIIGLKTEEDQLESLESLGVQDKAFKIAQLLVKDKTKWKDVADLLRDIDDDPEKIRRLVLSYANKCLLNGMGRAADIISVFKYNLFDCGLPGLTEYCWTVINQK